MTDKEKIEQIDNLMSQFDNEEIDDFELVDKIRDILDGKSSEGEIKK